jgi:hypothetical protein
MDAETLTLSNSFVAPNVDGYADDKERASLEPGQPTTQTNIMRYIKEDVDPECATAPLAACCFMSGLMCVFHFMFTFPTF